MVGGKKTRTRRVFFFGGRSFSGVCPAGDGGFAGLLRRLTEVAAQVATAAVAPVLTGAGESDGAAVGDAGRDSGLGSWTRLGSRLRPRVEVAAEPDGPAGCGWGRGCGVGCGRVLRLDRAVLRLYRTGLRLGGSVFRLYSGESGAGRGGPRVDQVLLQAGWGGLAGSAAGCSVRPDGCSAGQDELRVGRDGPAPCRGLGG